MVLGVSTSSPQNPKSQALTSTTALDSRMSRFPGLGLWIQFLTCLMNREVFV